MEAELSSDFIHRFVPGSNPSAPLLVLLHGTGGNENDLVPLGHALYPDAPLLSPRGRILENGMPRFFRRLAEGVFDEEDLVRRTHELADFVRAGAEHYGCAGRKIVATGYSNGANIAASTLLLRQGTFDGAVLLHAMVPLEPEQRPDLPGIPVFLGAGENDPIIPADNTKRLAALLKDAGADVSLFWTPGGHRIDPAELDEAKRWLERNFKSPK